MSEFFSYLARLGYALGIALVTYSFVTPGDQIAAALAGGLLIGFGAALGWES